MGWYVSPPSVRDVLPHGVVFRPVHGLYIPFGIDLMWRDERAPAMMAFVETVMAVSSGRAADACKSHLDFPAAG